MSQTPFAPIPPTGSRKQAGDLPLARLVPNMLTLMSLCSGLTGIRFALLDRWQEALLSIVMAAIFDILDGRVARLLRISSKFGAELDSLSDAISFGVAPAFIMYEWTLRDEASNGVGWIAVLIYAVCAVLRLARFNTMVEEEAPGWSKKFFTGIPAPGGAGIALWPLMLSLQFGPDYDWPKLAIAAWMVIAAGLMISRVPSLALKGWRIAPGWVPAIYILAVLLVAAAVTHIWLTLSVVGGLYILSLPVGWLMYRRQSRKQEITYAP